MAQDSVAYTQEVLRNELLASIAKNTNIAATANKSGTDTGIETGGLPGYDASGYPTTVDYSKVEYAANRGPDVDRSKGLATVSQNQDEQYNADQAYIDKAYTDGTISYEEYEARTNYLASAYENGTYMEDRTGGVRDVGYEYSDPNDADTNTSPLDTTTDASASNSTGLSTNGEQAKVVTIDSYISSYESSGARLLNFTHSDGSDDDNKIGYIKLLDTGSLMSKIAAGENKQNLDAIYTGLKARYNRFIITTIQESRSERSSIMPTVGDSFAATFSGREPMVLAVQGLLVCDHDKTKLTWYHAFMNAYEHYLRASRLAKFRVRMKLVLPDFTDYTGYMLNIGSTIASDNDMVIPMNFSMLVCNEAFNKAWGVNGSTEGEDQSVTITSVTDTVTATSSSSSQTTSTVASSVSSSAAAAAIAKTENVAVAGSSPEDPSTVATNNIPTVSTTAATESQVAQLAATTGTKTPAQSALLAQRAAVVEAQRAAAAAEAAARGTLQTATNPDGSVKTNILGERVKGGIQN